MKSVIIIGSGLGGMECGYILAKNGYKVTVLEHDAHLGGCLQSFQRGDCTFDIGFHYVGGLERGQSLHPLFRYFELENLPWQKMDEACFDEVVIGEQTFSIGQGYERFYHQLAERFPEDKEDLREYVDTLQNIGKHIYDVFLPDYQSDDRMTEGGLFAQNAYQWICNTIKNPILRDVLCGTSLKMQLDKERLPLYVFAQINNSYIQSAYRIKGGGSQIIDALRNKIESLGGSILLQATVTKILEENGIAQGVVINHSTEIHADYIISNCHPATTMELLKESASIRKVYRTRICGLENSYGMFTANIRLKKNAIAYINKNIYIHKKGIDLWDNATDVSHLLVHMYPQQDALDLVTPMLYEQVERWANKPRGHRGEDYVSFKNDIAEQCIRLAEKQIPTLRDAIEHINTSTPLSYEDYILAPRGTAYGVLKDSRSPLTTVLSVRTPIKNLFLTGQSINLHGILGVSMTSFFTCKQILGEIPNELLEYIDNNN